MSCLECLTLCFAKEETYIRLCVKSGDLRSLESVYINRIRYREYGSALHLLDVCIMSHDKYIVNWSFNVTNKYNNLVNTSVYSYNSPYQKIIAEIAKRIYNLYGWDYLYSLIKKYTYTEKIELLVIYAKNDVPFEIIYKFRETYVPIGSKFRLSRENKAFWYMMLKPKFRIRNLILIKRFINNNSVLADDLAITHHVFSFLFVKNIND
jgi:hypothetical protein